MNTFVELGKRYGFAPRKVVALYRASGRNMQRTVAALAAAKECGVSPIRGWLLAQMRDQVDPKYRALLFNNTLNKGGSIDYGV